MEEPYAFKMTARLWQLLLLFETLEDLPVETRPAPPLIPSTREMYETVVARAGSVGLVPAADVKAMGVALAEWREQSQLQREILRALVDDCEALLSDPIALEKAVTLISAWRRGRR